MKRTGQCNRPKHLEARTTYPSIGLQGDVVLTQQLPVRDARHGWTVHTQIDMQNGTASYLGSYVNPINCAKGQWMRCELCTSWQGLSVSRLNFLCNFTVEDVLRVRWGGFLRIIPVIFRVCQGLGIQGVGLEETSQDSA